ncbi:MAG: UPF0489 family protein [Coleofasciculus sp. S288]|nr:UPF0489 family protein [Coleofasciculus sp. S288]
MERIPLFIMEEHHEAFYLWNYAVINGWIKDVNNTLLHVDEHTDLQVPLLNSSLQSVRSSLEKLHTFTYTELSIADFIIPSVYQGIFDKIYWLRRKHDAKMDRLKFFVYSHQGNGQLIQLTENSSLAFFYQKDCKSFRLSSITNHDAISSGESLIVLDIDLDYFSCNDKDGAAAKIEITKEAYEAYTNDFYDELHLNLGGKGQVQKIDDKYYLYFSAPEIPNKLKVSEEMIVQRIDAFISFLETNAIKPKLIDICRSRLSGYTPRDQWEFIENKLLEKLGQLYDLEIKSIIDIMPPSTVSLKDELLSNRSFHV